MRYCHHPGCSALVTRGYCHAHQPTERHRPNQAIRRLYRTERWAAVRAQLFAADPLCPHCRAEGQLVAWTEVHHKVAHRGDLERFWDMSNLLGLCSRHHAALTARGE